MKKTYDEIDDLINDLETDIEDVLMSEVLDTVKDIEIERIEKDVFRVYSPKIYKRRNIDGIDDRDNIVGNLDENMSMTVENVTEFNDGYGTYNHGTGLAELINDGEGVYYYDYDGEFNEPRPFIDNTVDEIESTEQVDDAMAQGLRKKGYDIK